MQYLMLKKKSNLYRLPCVLIVPATVCVDGTGNGERSGKMGRELLLSAACPHTTAVCENLTSCTP